MPKPHVVCVVGTRPDAIKSAPVIRALRAYPEAIQTTVLSTGQHREMLAQALAAFDLSPDRDLAIMEPGQSLAQITARSVEGLDRIFRELRPQMVIAQGDTTTTFCAGLAAFYNQIDFGHVEAGLRTETVFNPFPEEFNRRAVAHFAAMHWAPTRDAADNLVRERIDPSKVFVTGNTGIDAVRYVADRAPQNWYPDHVGPIVLLTTHRRENWGEPQREIAIAARTIVESVPGSLLVVAMHRNPAVRETLRAELDRHPQIHLIEPPDYQDFVKLMERATLILSDSGGVQEEAPAFGRPVLVLRETTERPEGVAAGVAKLVGSDRTRIISEGARLLSDPVAYESMAKAQSPYGDGRAAERIRFLVHQHFGIASPPETMWI